MNANNVLNILNELNKVTASNDAETLTESITPIHHDAVVGTQVVEEEEDPNVVDDATSVGYDEEGTVFLCLACRDMYLEEDIEEDGVCPLCDSQVGSVEVGQIAPDGADNVEYATPATHITLTNESVNMDDEDDDEDDEELTENCDPKDDDDDEDETLEESMIFTEAKKKVVRNGQIVKIKVKTRKTKLTSKQKQALAKARRKSHTGSANKARRKSNKIRSRRGL